MSSVVTLSPSQLDLAFKGKENMNDIEAIAGNLVALKKVSMYLSTYSKVSERAINELLEELKRGQGMLFIYDLATHLKDQSNPAANALIGNQSAFDGYKNFLRNEKVAQKTFDKFIEVGGNVEDVIRVGAFEDDTGPRWLKTDEQKNLKEVYEQICDGEGHYWSLVEKGTPQQTREAEVRNIVENALRLAQDTAFPSRDKVVALMAHVFAYWTLHMLSLKGAPDRDRRFLFKPHAGQIFGIARLLGVDKMGQGQGSADNLFENHLVQILTGEGKSVILAVTSTVLALLGYKVDCACYSKYLSE